MTLNSIIADSSDGPATAFVMMMRACKLARLHDTGAVANALLEELQAREYLSPAGLESLEA